VHAGAHGMQLRRTELHPKGASIAEFIALQNIQARSHPPASALHASAHYSAHSRMFRHAPTRRPLPCMQVLITALIGAQSPHRHAPAW